MAEAWKSPEWRLQTQSILDSYRRWVGEELIPRTGDEIQDAANLFRAPRVVVSHNTLDDPVLNYGNQRALALWEVDIPTLLAMPSRLTAEPVHRDERARLLRRTSEQGFVDDYRGVRVSSTGKRFWIERATVWNLVSKDGTPAGQAATFEDWQPLQDDELPES